MLNPSIASEFYDTNIYKYAYSLGKDYSTLTEDEKK
jgi:hypothetical protein